jgi:hypothetical protein
MVQGAFQTLTSMSGAVYLGELCKDLEALCREVPQAFRYYDFPKSSLDAIAGSVTSLNLPIATVGSL